MGERAGHGSLKRTPREGSMYLGIDIGTSGVKAVVVDDAGEVVDRSAATRR